MNRNKARVCSSVFYLPSLFRLSSLLFLSFTISVTSFAESSPDNTSLILVSISSPLESLDMSDPKSVEDVLKKYNALKKKNEKVSQVQQAEINKLATQGEQTLRNILMVVLALLLLFALNVYYRYRQQQQAHITLAKAHSELEDAHEELAEAHNLIYQEKEKADKLLLNILPVRVANDLKERNQTEPESFENVTIYFSDIVGFTNLSSELDPKFLIDELNDIFTAFDNIVEKYHCERIKTIGDAYLCVSGMPDPDPNHAENVVHSALEIIDYIKQRNLKTQVQWEIRVGIHTGRVVGGVVGVKKYIYDVFGDSINTAARMESYSEPMKINISETTYQLVKDAFEFSPRGLLDVKGKGDMKMYFVEGERVLEQTPYATA